MLLPFSSNFTGDQFSINGTYTYPCMHTHTHACIHTCTHTPVVLFGICWTFTHWLINRLLQIISKLNSLLIKNVHCCQKPVPSWPVYFMHAHICRYTDIGTQMLTWMHACTHIYIHVHTHTYKHTQTHTNTMCMHT